MAPLPCSGDRAMVAPAPPTARRRGRARRLAATAALGLVLLGGACGVGRDTATDAGSDEIDELLDARTELYGDVTWARVDQRLDDLVSGRDLPGAALVVRRVDGDDHVHRVGEVDLAAPVPLGETTSWLVAAVLLGLVDEGALGLDDPVGPTLPWLDGPAASVTLRQLLSHTSGLPDAVTCPEPTPEACDAAIAAAGVTDPPGEAFRVTPLDAHVAARLAEAITGMPWSDVVADRLLAPLGLEQTAFADPATTGGLVAVDGTTTPDELGRFLAMIRDDGEVDGDAVLSGASVKAMLLDQTTRLDTHTEPWVAETGVPTYGLGVWRDRLRGSEEAAVASAPNRFGLYPFVDVPRGAWGIVVVDDPVSPRARNVSESAVVSQLAVAVMRRSADD